jgi:hypothetical protein
VARGADGHAQSHLHYDRMLLILEPTPRARGLARKKVEVSNYPDGRFAVQFKGSSLSFSGVRQGPNWTARRDRGQQAAVSSARDGEGTAGGIRAERSAWHVAQQRPPNNLEAPGLPLKGRAPRGTLAVATS